MAKLSCLLLVMCLRLLQAIVFNDTSFSEEYMCELGGRVLGVCSEFAHCTAVPAAREQCGISGTKQVCCPRGNPQEPVPSKGHICKSKCREFADVEGHFGCPPLRPYDGSNKVIPEEFPHIAALGYELWRGSGEIRWLCAGSLISERFVLTELACGSGTKITGRPKHVRLGDLELRSPLDDAYAEQLKVQRVYRYIKANIALVEMERDVPFSPFIRPACLHTERTIPAKRAVAVGWGRTSSFSNSAARTLHKVDLPLLTRRKCKEIFNFTEFGVFFHKTGHLKRSHLLCAGEMAGRKDTCMGDGGAPLMVKLAHPYCTYSIVAVSAFGSIPCAQPHKPSVFTRIYYSIPWIEKVVWRTK